MKKRQRQIQIRKKRNEKKNNHNHNNKTKERNQIWRVVFSFNHTVFRFYYDINESSALIRGFYDFDYCIDIGLGIYNKVRSSIGTDK